MSVEYAIVVKNKTRLESLIERFNTKAQAQFYIESLGGNFTDYLSEHDVFYASLHELQTKLSRLIKHKIVERRYLPSYLFADTNVIVVIGQDGLVANTAKYANNVPIVAVNPDRERYDGVLLPFSVDDFAHGVEKVIGNGFNSRTVRFAEARLNDGQVLRAFNDLFIGVSSHTSARYRLTVNSESEEQSSSGVIVSTGAGVTGWLSSVFNMAYGVAGMFEKNLTRKRPKVHDDELIFAVREPFKSVKTQIDLAVGRIGKGDKLVIESLMPSGGVIFSDGIEADFIRFNSGAIATIGISSDTARLVLNE